MIKLLKYLLVAALLFNLQAISQNARMDSLLKLINSAASDTTKATLLNNLAWELRTSDPKRSIKLSQQAYNLCISTNWEAGKARSQNYLGSFHRITGNYHEALTYFNQSLLLYEKLGNKTGESSVLGNIGNIYWNRKDHEKALSYYFRALSLTRNLGSRSSEAVILSNIGSVYYNTAKFSSALNYFQEALKIAEGLDNKLIIANSLSNIGEVYSMQGEEARLQKNNVLAEYKYNRALDYFFRSLQISEEKGLKSIKAMALANAGKIYLDYPALPSPAGVKLNGLKLAETYLEQALNIAKETGDLESLKTFNEELSRLYVSQGKWKQALDHFKDYSATRDSISNEENIQNFIRAEVNAEYDKKEAIASEERERDIIIRNGLITGFLFVLIFGIFTFRNFRQKQKANVELDMRHRELEQAYTIIEKQKQTAEENNKVLKKIVKDKEVLFKEVHHRVKNNLQIISSMLNLQSNALSDEHAVEVIRQSQSRVNAMAILHHKLYQTEDFSKVPIDTYLKQLTNSIHDSFSSNQASVSFDILTDKELRFNLDTAIPVGLIINELVTNSFKHAFKGKQGGLITIHLSKSDDNFYNLVVADDGFGFDPKQNSNVSSQSLGLELVQILVQQLQGYLTISNHNGARFEIKFAGVPDKAVLHSAMV